MASVRRFGSCSSCQLRNTRENGKGRRWKCRSAVPEWLVGSRIKAQGEEEDDWKREKGAATAKDASKAGGVVFDFVFPAESHLFLMFSLKLEWI